MRHLICRRNGKTFNDRLNNHKSTIKHTEKTSIHYVLDLEIIGIKKWLINEIA